MQEKQGDRREGWHVGKEIPLAMIFAIIMQTCGVIWWAAVLTTKLDDLSYQVAALSADKYSQKDAEKDKQIIMQQINFVSTRVDKLERKQK